MDIFEILMYPPEHFASYSCFFYFQNRKINLRNTLKFVKIKLKTPIACFHYVKVKFYYNYLIIFFIGFLRFHKKIKHTLIKILNLSFYTVVILNRN